MAKPNNTKKDIRFAAKKRKLQAYFNLIGNDILSERKDGSFQESYKILKTELKKYSKKPFVEPKFSLKNSGLKESLNSKLKISTLKPLFIDDVYRLLLTSVLGHLSPFPTHWCELENPQNVANTLIVVLDDMPKQYIIDKLSELSFIPENFLCGINVLSSDVPFATELSTVHLASDFYNRAHRSYSSLFSDVENGEDILTEKKMPSKLHLLLSPIQLAMENFPLPKDVFESSKCTDYKFTKDSYTHVTANSPIYGADCEMCLLYTGESVLTRVAIVNEDLETVYHTLVKPKSKIKDYMTKYSGITEEMLRDVTTTIDDVQEDIRNLLPSDAILCGQSLNFDLHALKLIHPYIIDTSVIFNENGTRQKKTSLKKLFLRHFDEVIQDDPKGHHPVEDSIAVMKLVNLKLNKYLEYGDTVFGDYELSKDLDPPKFSNVLKLQTYSENTFNGFFHRIARFKKKTCLIGNEEVLNHYVPEMVKDSATLLPKSNMKKITKAVCKSFENYDLAIAHLPFKEVNDTKELNQILEDMYENCPQRTLFSLLIPGSGLTRHFKKGLFFTVFKKD